MPKTKWLLLALLLPGCGGGGGQSPLIGRWRVASVETRGYSTTCPGELWLPGSVFASEVCGPNDEFRFEDNGSYSHTHVQYDLLTREEGEYRQTDGTYTAEILRGGSDNNHDGRVTPDEVGGLGWGDGPPTQIARLVDNDTVWFTVTPCCGQGEGTTFVLKRTR
jgi:hypothetical protein